MISTQAFNIINVIIRPSHDIPNRLFKMNTAYLFVRNILIRILSPNLQNSEPEWFFVGETLVFWHFRKKSFGAEFAGNSTFCRTLQFSNGSENSSFKIFTSHACHRLLISPTAKTKLLEKEQNTPKIAYFSCADFCKLMGYGCLDQRFSENKIPNILSHILAEIERKIVQIW